jgi:hypothetical protein
VSGGVAKLAKVSVALGPIALRIESDGGRHFPEDVASSS